MCGPAVIGHQNGGDVIECRDRHQPVHAREAPETRMTELLLHVESFFALTAGTCNKYQCVFPLIHNHVGQRAEVLSCPAPLRQQFRAVGIDENDAMVVGQIVGINLAHQPAHLLFFRLGDRLNWNANLRVGNVGFGVRDLCLWREQRIDHADEILGHMNVAVVTHAMSHHLAAVEPLAVKAMKAHPPACAAEARENRREPRKQLKIHDGVDLGSSRPAQKTE